MKFNNLEYVSFTYLKYASTKFRNSVKFKFRQFEIRSELASTRELHNNNKYLVAALEHLRHRMAPPPNKACAACASSLSVYIRQIAFCVVCAQPFCAACIAVSNSIPEGSEVAAEENMCFPCHRKPRVVPRLADREVVASVPYGNLRVEISTTNRFSAPFRLDQPSPKPRPV